MRIFPTVHVHSQSTFPINDYGRDLNIAFPEISVRIGFVSFTAPGHMNPMTALARTLQARGHDVTILGIPEGESLVRAAQLPFIPYAQEDYPFGKVHAVREELGRLTGQEAMEFTFRYVAGFIKAAFTHLPQTIKDSGMDALVLDEAQFGLGLIPMHLKIPYAHFSCALPFDFSGRTPLSVFDWQQTEATPETFARNYEGLQKVRSAFAADLARCTRVCQSGWP
jgi:zeaxanthin glucosyltransferase